MHSILKIDIFETYNSLTNLFNPREFGNATTMLYGYHLTSFKLAAPKK